MVKSRNGITAFAIPLVFTCREAVRALPRQPLYKRREINRVCRCHDARMCVSEGESKDSEGAMQGPSQAPTKAGVSTAGLSEPEAKFIEACYLPDVEVIEKMLDEGIDPSTADVNGRTALHFCAGNGLPTICTKLLDSGADINKQDVTGLTPLHMATGYKKPETVRLLLERNADANITSFQGQLPVELAESMLEKTPKKRFFVANGDYTKLQELVAILDEATEEEDVEDVEDEDEVDGKDEGEEVMEETESAKFVVRVKPKGATASKPPTVAADDVKVTIRVKEPGTKE